MKCLVIHNRKTSGPKESSWWTFHYISEELKRRGHLYGQYSVDYELTNDEGKTITDKEWEEADFIFTVFRNGIAPLKIAKARGIPSVLEINYACEQIATPFMQKELKRMNIPADEIMYEHYHTTDELYTSATYLIGAGNPSYTEKTYRDYGLKKVKFFNAGIDCDIFKPDFKARAEHKKVNPRIRFTFTAATLTHRKGLFYTMRAWRSLPKEYQDHIELHFFGKPPYGKQSASEFAEFKKDFPNVIHHPFMSNFSEEYRTIHGLSDVMLCPALAEGQSATALEGMSFGLYPIVSPFSGSDFEKMPSTILSADPANWIEELKATIMHVVDNYEKIKATAPVIREYAQKTYQYPVFAREVVDFMEKVHAEHKKK
jgi:hypothetical protein